MIIALNNKSNLDKNTFLDYCQELEKLDTKETLILCPTFLNASTASLTKVHLGVQNVSATNDGAYTGEISATQLKSYNVEYAIIGHSERREYQKETVEEIHNKLIRLLENNITPILCIGETLEERKEEKVEEVLGNELSTAIQDLSEEDKEKIIVAYEPIWSIGTGVIPTNEEIESVFHFIKTILPHNKILYGGSANENNIDTLKTITMIDGYLLGGLSLKPDKLQVFIQKLN